MSLSTLIVQLNQYYKCRKIAPLGQNFENSKNFENLKEKMNNIAETDQEREYRKHKNTIIWLIVLNICPVYAGKIQKSVKIIGV